MHDETMTHAHYRADEKCQWCGITARAIPDEPPVVWDGRPYHRTGCLASARLVAAGALPEKYRPVTELPEWVES